MKVRYIVSEAVASAVCEVAKRKNGSLIHPAFGYELEKGVGVNNDLEVVTKQRRRCITTNNRGRTPSEAIECISD